MMRWIVGSSLKARGLVIAAALVVMVLGISQLHTMPRDVLPEFRPPTVEVQTEALGLSAEEVEQLITVPLEQDLLNGVAFLDVIRSRSVTGLSSIELVFKRGTNLSRARQLVNERLTQAHALPNVSKPPQMLQPLSSTSRAMMVGLSSTQLSLIDMGVLARWTIRPRLMGVPGVANVAIWGQRDRQLQVQVDPEQLRAKGVTLDQVVRTTGNALFVSPLSFLEASTPGTGGFVDGPNQRLGIQHNLPIKTADDLAKVTLDTNRASATDGGAPTEKAPAAPSAIPPLRLGDVAHVVEDHQPLIGDAGVTDGPGLMLVVEKFPQANVMDVTRGVDKALKSLAPGLGGLKMDSSVYRPANYISKSTSNLTWALAVGLVLLLALLGAVLLHWRTAVISLVAIVLSMVAALWVLHLRGATVNVMVLAGLVLAVVLVIDDAVIGTGNVRRLLRQHRQEESAGPAADVIMEASLQARGAASYALVIILLAIMPIFVLKGEAGAFLPPLASSYAIAVLVSMVVALTVTPALSLLLLSKERADRPDPPVVRWLHRGHDRWAPRWISSPGKAYVAIAVLLAVGIGALPFLDRGPSLVPSFKDTGLLVHLDGPPGTSLPEMNRIAARASQELRSLPGVRDVGSHSGRAVMSDQVSGSNTSELWVNLDAKADYDKTVASVRRVVDGYPGLERAVVTYPQERISQLLQKRDHDITVRVYGTDLAILNSKATEVSQALSKIHGVVNPKVQAQAMEPTIEVKVDLTAAQRYGIKPGDVRRAAATVLSGVEVGSLFEQQKVFEVVVWGVPQARNSLTKVRDVLIDTPSGDSVRMGDVADVHIAPNLNVIQHQDVSRYVDVGANVSGRDIGAVAREVKTELHEMTFPLEHHAELLGDYAQRRANHVRFLAFAIGAAIGIFLLLQAAFGSWRLAAVAFLVLPLSLSGGALAALLAGRVSLGTLAGFFAVFGIAARNCIVLVRRYQQVEHPENGVSRAQMVADETRDHLVPILATSLGTALAFLPLILLGGIAGQEMAHPLAAVVVGGLVTSTLVSLLIVPALYLRFAPRLSRGEAGRREVLIDHTAPSLAGNGHEVPAVATTHLLGGPS